MSYTYFEELPADARKRYCLKLGVVGIEQCPYKYPADVWLNKPTDWPSVGYPDIYNYLIDTPGK